MQLKKYQYWCSALTGCKNNGLIKVSANAGTFIVLGLEEVFIYVDKCNYRKII